MYRVPDTTPSLWPTQSTPLSARGLRGSAGYTGFAGYGNPASYGQPGLDDMLHGAYREPPTASAMDHQQGLHWQIRDEHAKLSDLQQLDIARLREQLAREEAAAQNIRMRIQAANRNTSGGEAFHEPFGHAAVGSARHNPFASPSAWPPLQRNEKQSLAVRPATLHAAPRDFSEADPDCWAMWVRANWECDDSLPARGSASRQPNRSLDQSSVFKQQYLQPLPTLESAAGAEVSSTAPSSATTSRVSASSQHPLSDEDKRAIRKAVTQRCARLYLEGQLRGFQVLKPDLVFDKKLANISSEGGENGIHDQKVSAGSSPSKAGSAQVCGACGRKFAPDSRECEKCGRARDAVAMCSCGHPVDPDSKFCRKCGKMHIVEHCISCGASLPADVKFCCDCGRPRNTPRPPVICRCGNKLPNDAKACRKCQTPRPEPDSCVCGEVLRPDAKFCRKCGKPRPPPGPFCSSCGERFAPDALFCQNCGQPKQNEEEHAERGAGFQKDWR